MQRPKQYWRPQPASSGKRPVLILWLSRHAALPVEVQWLREHFGEVRIDQDVNPFDSAESISRQFQIGGYDELVVIAPLSVNAKLIELGIRPLWAETLPVSKAEAHDFEYRGQPYRFLRFRRLVAVELKYEEL